VAYERPADWSGVYFGVGSGYQWSSIDVSSPLAVTLGLPLAGTAFTSDHGEAFVSAHLGVQHQWGPLVLGIEGGWMSTLRDRNGSHETCNTPLVFPIFAVGDTCTARLQDILTIGGRAGYAWGKWMPYLTGGYANAAVDFENRLPQPGNPGLAGATTLVEQAHTRLGGWYVGGGVEWAISRVGRPASNIGTTISAAGTPRRALVAMVRLLLLTVRGAPRILCLPCP
jgi:outer membrane immunogenic protein